MLKCAKKTDQRPIPGAVEAIQQFEKCKIGMANTTLLFFPKPGLPLSLYNHASDWTIGSI